MATRPRTVKLSKGKQATLLYMSDDEADQLEKLLLNFDGQEKMEGALPALGMYKNLETGKYNLVTLEYNPLTKEAKVVTVEETSNLQSYAGNEFKKRAIKLKIV